MAVLFPTREVGKQGRRMGQPRQAETCGCEHPIYVVGDDLETCLRCGHLPVEIVAATWARQARMFAGSHAVELLAA